MRDFFNVSGRHPSADKTDHMALVTADHFLETVGLPVANALIQVLLVCILPLLTGLVAHQRRPRRSTIVGLAVPPCIIPHGWVADVNRFSTSRPERCFEIVHR